MVFVKYLYYDFFLRIIMCIDAEMNKIILVNAPDLTVNALQSSTICLGVKLLCECFETYQLP